MAGKRSETSFVQHTHRGICAHSFMGSLSAMGLGNERQRAGSFLSEKIWISYRVKWSYTPDHAKSRRQYYFSYGNIYRISAATSRRSSGTGPNESTGRTVAFITGTNLCTIPG